MLSVSAAWTTGAAALERQGYATAPERRRDQFRGIKPWPRGANPSRLTAAAHFAVGPPSLTTVSPNTSGNGSPMAPEGGLTPSRAASVGAMS